MHKIEQRSVMMNKGANKLKTLIDNFSIYCISDPYHRKAQATSTQTINNK